MATPLKVEFQFDFGSPNAYLAECAIPQIERRTGIKFDYVPVLLGGIYKLTGNMSPAESLRGIKNKLEYQALETQRFIRRRNITRFRNDEYDRLFRAADTELDPVKRAALFIKMNDLVIQNVVVIPVLWRNGVSAVGARLRGLDLSGWDNNTWRLPYWHRV